MIYLPSENQVMIQTQTTQLVQNAIGTTLW